MDIILKLFLIASIIIKCNGISYLEQLQHILETRRESQGLHRDDVFTRRVNPQTSVILGAPSYPSHLPEAEAILPGHTLIRPSINMLKSAVKFPHKDLDDGAGVYGNIDNLGLRYDGKNERVLYTGFRRMPQDHDYVIIIPPTSQEDNSSHETRPSKSKKLPINFLLKYIADFSRRNNTPSNSLSDDYSSDDTDDILNEDQNKNPTEIKDNQNSKALKLVQFWKTKDSFNHIQIDPDAPELSEFLPEINIQKLQDWWFYYQKKTTRL